MPNLWKFINSFCGMRQLWVFRGKTIKDLWI